MLLEDQVNEYVNQNKPIKLHLGCGSRYLDGYINVDGEYLVSDPNVTIHDITKPFPVQDNKVDEILTVHVLEHLHRNMLLPMFKEWHRILRPGGFAAVEWPDLLKMCKEVVKDPSCMWSEDKKVLKRTVSGIYGDSVRYPDPVMLHKWGYSEESMSRLFKSAGFSRVEIQINHHAKSHIDSRVVAFK